MNFEVEPSDWLWKEGAGYYSGRPEELRKNPHLPNPGRLRDRRVIALFDSFGGVAEGARVLELGCGGSPWLPWLARNRGARVTGIDVEPFAAEMARANLDGAGATGEVLCRDAFNLAEDDPIARGFDLVYSMGVMEHFGDVVDQLKVAHRYVRPGGRILTAVPNLQGINWVLQRLGDLRTLRAHVIYHTRRLREVHEAAGFRTLGVGYTGFFDGHLSSGANARSAARRQMHAWLCRLTSLGSEAWVRAVRGTATPEAAWWSPYVYYAGEAPKAALDPVAVGLRYHQ